MSTLSEKALLLFLRDIDNELPETLSSRVNLNEYAHKLYEHADITTLEENNNLVGVLAAYADCISQSAYISIIAVKKEHSGKGNGGKMLSDFIEKCKKNIRISRLHLHTSQSNYKAIHFYEKYGFKVCREQFEQRSGDLHFCINTAEKCQDDICIECKKKHDQ